MAELGEKIWGYVFFLQFVGELLAIWKKKK